MLLIVQDFRKNPWAMGLVKNLGSFHNCIKIKVLS